MKALLALVLSAAVSLVAERAARACSAPACQESWSAPDVGKKVPANAPALVFVQGTAPLGGTATAGPPVLKSAAGTIAYTRDGNLLKPTSALPVGNVTLEWDETCVYPPTDAGVAKKQLVFEVVAASALPTALGTATVSYARQNVDVWTSAGSCTAPLDSSVAKLSFVLDPALQAFRDVARFVTTVDGKEWGSSAFGREGPRPSPAPYGGDLGMHRHDLVFAGCGPSPVGVTDRGVVVGKHTVEIRAEVAGAPTIPSATFEIDLRCEGEVPDGGSVTPDAAAPDASITDASGLDASVPDGGKTPEPESSAGGGGCATGRTTALPFPLALAAFVFAARRRPTRRR